MSKTIGSRQTSISDDLYALYLAGLAWLLIPIYSSVVALVLPSDLRHFDRAVDASAAALLVCSIWLGRRGGPFLLNRAFVIHELNAPMRRRDVLGPRLLRQAVAYGVLAAVGVAALGAMGEPGTFGYERAVRHSLVLGVAALTSVVQTVGWMVFWKGRTRPPRAAALNALGTALVVAVLGFGHSLSSGIGAAALGLAFVLAVIGTVGVLDDVPIEHLWRRAVALEGMRSAALTFDFQRVLVSLRRAVDQTESRPSPLPLARSWMPRSLWRYLAGFERGWNTRAGQIVMASVGTFALLAVLDPTNGVGALAVTAAGFVLGFELASPLAAAAGQLDFGVHYPKGSKPVLRSHLLTAVALAIAIGAASTSWFVAQDPAAGIAVLGLFVFGTAAAAVQGRLGSPDLVALTKTFGASVGTVMWIRALLGPLLCFAMAVAVSHGWLRPDGWAGWPTVASVLTVATLALATHPLEKRLP